MPQEPIEITVQTGSRTVICRHVPGNTLLQTLQCNGIHLSAPCGGTGRCGKCLVRISDETAAGPRLPREAAYAPEGSGTRLACLALPIAPCTVTLEGIVRSAHDDSVQKGGTFPVAAGGVPVVRAVELALPAATLGDQRSVHRRLIDEVKRIGETAQVSLAAVRETLSLMTAAAGDHSAVESDEGHTGIHAGGLVLPGTNGQSLAAVLGEVSALLPALAVDIGTTTIAAYLVDLASRDFLAIRSEENLQARYGADVVSRIAAVSAGNDLTAVVRGQLSRVVEEMADEAGISREDVLAATVVGNPTMLHLFFGLDARSIGYAPFMPATSEGLTVQATDLGLSLHPAAVVFCPPGVSAYVGADIVADVVATGMDLGDGGGDRVLLIDVGTNGEMVLKTGDGMIACSTAAGPAFEGANIRCGSGGVAGAISAVTRIGDSLEVTTIASRPARSICGSGLLDLIAILLDDLIIDETGFLDVESTRTHATYRNRLEEVGGEAAVVVDDEGNVFLTQSDIRQVQLAKGAIAAGVRSLFADAEIDGDAIDQVVLAGGFGTYVRPESACRVGLLPGIPPERVRSGGNTAGEGAVLLLTDESVGERAKQVASAIRYIELSSSAAFQHFFAEEMLFPAP